MLLCQQLRVDCQSDDLMVLVETHSKPKCSYLAAQDRDLASLYRGRGRVQSGKVARLLESLWVDFGQHSRFECSDRDSESFVGSRGNIRVLDAQIRILRVSLDPKG
uniref:Uncharacterized protein n=1 Tax=Solanum tuberosum TaxID=4113 RepID=M1DAX7_SOLTU